MFYGTIKNCDIADGEGCRVSLFVSGCRHHCKGCFNEATWDFRYGEVFTKETEDMILEYLKPAYIHGLTLLGGEPFEVPNQRILLPFLRRVKAAYPEKTIWSYTGYRLEKDLLSPEVPGSGRLNARCECTDEMLSMIDVLVDGRFVLEKKDISLAFCGSSNQRLIDLKKTLAPYFALPAEERKPAELQIVLYQPG
ncbi:MAG: anaerobic ribonucleoside-triphosphate reductase activating protein [Lachnospiraceae bacterium]|nr:anaerobic ribonucleoside-triphosphate reductase activating protein [Lachnospiraceae bacterium]